MPIRKRKLQDKGPRPLTTRSRLETHTFKSYDAATAWKANIVGDKVKTFKRADGTFDVVIYGPQREMKA